ncbi:MAG: 4Fe-4S dicluster domain-containing protein [Planctomycetota bacterium]|jgi:ferredoxin
MPVVSKIKIIEASISRENLRELLKETRKERMLIAPVRDERYEDVNFLPVSEVGEICFDYENTTTSPKEYFFPQSECMFRFSGASNESIEVSDSGEEIVIFGIRSCDVRGIELLDKFYERDFEDNYYLDKRRRSVLISVACSELNEQCFCTSTGTGPVLEDGFDIQLIGAGDGCAVQIGSERGLGLFERYRDFFEPAVEVNVRQMLEQAKKSGVKFELRKLYENLKGEKVKEELWADIASRCQSCGLCLFLCPTCSCYTVIDGVTPGGESRRSRQWDACYFRGFTRMTGGNDSVRSNEEMVKRKYTHKLLQQIDEFAMSGCTGCGRCNLCCVGNVNWLENIVKIERGG